MPLDFDTSAEPRPLTLPGPVAPEYNCSESLGAVNRLLRRTPRPRTPHGRPRALSLLGEGRDQAAQRGSAASERKGGAERAASARAKGSRSVNNLGITPELLDADVDVSDPGAGHVVQLGVAEPSGRGGAKTGSAIRLARGEHGDGQGGGRVVGEAPLAVLVDHANPKGLAGAEHVPGDFVFVLAVKGEEVPPVVVDAIGLGVVKGSRAVGLRIAPLAGNGQASCSRTHRRESLG